MLNSTPNAIIFHASTSDDLSPDHALQSPNIERFKDEMSEDLRQLDKAPLALVKVQVKSF